ncbi:MULTISPECIES: hypothetical protein [unclassified Bradyrhizobium]|uniref:hypothetical protein n=1 Tax=unclassified Bradyrhizobium TaxID=2631580 RepID=UPI0035C713A8
MKAGTPQGAVISPRLANIYLHYVYDLWLDAWQKRRASGDMIVVRYADDSAPRRRRRCCRAPLSSLAAQKMEAAPRTRVAGSGFKLPAGASAHGRGGRGRKRQSKTLSGKDRRDERKRTTDELSKA